MGPQRTSPAALAAMLIARALRQQACYAIYQRINVANLRLATSLMDLLQTTLAAHAATLTAQAMEMATALVWCAQLKSVPVLDHPHARSQTVHLPTKKVALVEMLTARALSRQACYAWLP